MDPLSVSASVVALGGAGAGVGTALKAFCRDFRDAPSQILHAQRQGAHLQTNQAQSNELPPRLRDAVKPANSSIADIQAALSRGTGSGRKRDCLRWAASRKGRVDAQISRLKDAESSTILTLSVAAFKEV
jgi:hypothetical protein